MRSLHKHWTLIPHCGNALTDCTFKSYEKEISAIWWMIEQVLQMLSVSFGKNIADANQIDISLLKGTGPEGSNCERRCETAFLKEKSQSKKMEKGARYKRIIAVKPCRTCFWIDPNASCRLPWVKSNREIPPYIWKKDGHVPKAMGLTKSCQ